MAVWQFDLHFIRVGDPTPDTTVEDWDVPTLPASYALEAQRILLPSYGPPWLMLEDWLVVGLEDGNRVDILFGEPGTASIRVRIDARSDSVKFQMLISELAQRLRCLLFSPEFGRLVEPNVDSLFVVLDSSRARDFSRNPGQC